MCNRAACALSQHELQASVAKFLADSPSTTATSATATSATATSATATSTPAAPAVTQLEWSSPLRTWQPSYSIRPTNTVPVLVPGAILDVMRWGLLPPYHKGDPRDFKLATFNCRLEGLMESKASGVFGPALAKGQRCAVLVSGFFEWHDEGAKGKQPYFLHSGAELLVLAGLYEIMPAADIKSAPTCSCTIITVPSNANMMWLNDRTPAVLASPAALNAWLDSGSVTAEKVLSMLSPLPAILYHPVTRSAGAGRPSDASLVKPVPLLGGSQRQLATWLAASSTKPSACAAPRVCAACTLVNGPHALVCAECHSVLASAAGGVQSRTTVRACPACTFANPASRAACSMCELSLPDADSKGGHPPDGLFDDVPVSVSPAAKRPRIHNARSPTCTLDRFLTRSEPAHL